MSKQPWLCGNCSIIIMISITAKFYLGNNTQVTYHQYRRRMETDQTERRLKLWKKTFSPISQHTHGVIPARSRGASTCWGAAWIRGGFLRGDAKKGGESMAKSHDFSLFSSKKIYVDGTMASQLCLHVCVCVSAFIVTLSCAHACPCCSGFLDLLMLCILARVLLTCTLASFIIHQKQFYLQANWSILKGWTLTGGHFNCAANAEEFGR